MMGGLIDVEILERELRVKKMKSWCHQMIGDFGWP
jgi:hypothetical protein